MKILISGISGFVGQNLVEFLNKNNNFEIFGLDILQHQMEGVSNIYHWDELSGLPDFDSIIHLAGKAHDTENRSEESEYFEINYGLTKKIYDFFLNSNTKKFIFISTVKAVADRVNGVLTEEVKADPKTPYGKSKLEAEKYIMSLLPEKRNVYIFRPCMIYGKNNKGNLNILYKLISKGIPWPLGTYKNDRSFLSVINFSFIINDFLLNNHPGGIYNLADNDSISTNELIGIISAAANKNVLILKLPKPIIKIAALMGSVFHLSFNLELLKKLTENYVVSNKKLIAIMNKALPVKSKEGLYDTLKSL